MSCPFRTSASQQNKPLSNPLKFVSVLYASSAFVCTWIFFACFIIFLGNLSKWLRIDGVAILSAPQSLIWNLGLVAAFATQHSLMARPYFKRAIERVIPGSLERSTYVHAANVAGLLLIFLWQPIPDLLWSIENDLVRFVIWSAFAAGWAILFLGAISINVFELLGLRQAAYFISGRSAPTLELKTGGLFAFMKHPMYVGVLLGLWATPDMSLGHAVLASSLMIYIAIAMQWEARDLEARFGQPYVNWNLGTEPVDPLPDRIQTALQRLALSERRQARM